MGFEVGSWSRFAFCWVSLAPSIRGCLRFFIPQRKNAASSVRTVALHFVQHFAEIGTMTGRFCSKVRSCNSRQIRIAGVGAVTRLIYESLVGLISFFYLLRP